MNSVPYPWQSEQWQRLNSQLRDDRLAHAYLLSGERGLGKHAFANAAARLLLCEQPAESQACGDCRSCELFTAGSNPDLLTIAPENSQVIKVDQIRELGTFASKTSHGKRRKVLVLDQVDALNLNAANALLKTLEEPPGSTVLFLITATPGMLLATIRSRCQQIQFATPTFQIALKWLTEQSENRDGLEVVLKQANSRPLLALNLLDPDEQEQRNNIMEALAAIFSSRLDPAEFASHGKTIGADKILEQLWYLTATSIKQFLTEANGPVDRQVQAVLQAMSHSRRTEDELLGRLLVVNQSVEDARKQLTGPSNPNPQLILESILWRWSRLLQ